MDKAVEFGKYLADAAEQFLNAYNLRALAEDSGEEVDVDGFSDCFRALRSAIYEFRKRCDVAEQPSGHWSGDASSGSLPR